MRQVFDNIVLSSNENPKYIQFWPLVSWAWKSLFNAKVHLAFVTNRQDNDPYIEELRKHGNVVVYPEIDGIPSANNSKMARHYFASILGEEVCLINDVDLLPLQREYIYNVTDKFLPNSILCVGADVYKGSVDEGKFPIGYMTAKGNTFREIINPNNLQYTEWIKSFIGNRVFDHKEDISSNVDNENPETFSDESIFRCMIHRWNKPDRVIHIERGFNPYTQRAIDRASWKNDPELLANGTYVEAHLSRPFDAYIEQFKPLIEHIRKKYEQ